MKTEQFDAFIRMNVLFIQKAWWEGEESLPLYTLWKMMIERMRKGIKYVSLFGWMLAMCLMVACRQSSAPAIGDLYAEFQRVPDSTRTKVWWFHGETATTREGITADLEAFRQAGVGGVVYYDQVHGKAEGADTVFSTAWWEALKFAASEARRLGLTFEISLSNGYVAGGPWITKAQSMKRLCQSEVVVKGGGRFDDLLPAPSSDEFWDVRTLAFPVPQEVEWQKHTLIDKKVKFDTPTRLVYDLKEPFTARSFTYSEYNPAKHPTLCMNWPGTPSDTFYGDGYAEYPPVGQLEASDDGVHYRKVCDLPTLYRMHHRVKTLSFPPVTARYFRLNLHDWDLPDKHRQLELRSAILSAQAMTEAWESRAGVVSEYIGENHTPDYTLQEVIDPKRIIDLTEKLQPDGRLTWTAPDDADKWVVLRVAQTSTRGRTKHGRPGQMGLECDKLSGEAACLQWKNFAQVIIDTLAKYNLKPVGVVMDSHEVGSQNWTHGYEQEFAHLKGYDLTTYLPALLGYVVGSKEKSEEVLLHHRQTLAHLVNLRYFATLDSLAMQAGVNLTAQAMGNAQHMVCDNIAAKGSVRRPQGEFWAKHNHGSYDIKEVSSAAHLYGCQVASAEAYTDAKYSQSLAYLKSLADYAYAFQLNEFMVCASAYQPWTDKQPGNTANGREYCLNRNNTQWALSRGFWDYQARCAYLMRQGTPVVDLCIYAGSELPVKLLSHRLPHLPEGYDWDLCTDDALLHILSADNGRLKARGGMEYRALVVERLARLTDEAEAKIAWLKEQGVPVYDARMAGDDGLKPFLDKKGIAPDVALESGNAPDNRVLFAHRKCGEADIYFFYNHSESPFKQSFTLRHSQGLVPEYWNPDNGQRYSLEHRTLPDGKLEVWLALAPYEAGFVVTHPAEVMDKPLLSRTWGGEEQVVPMNHDWLVDFILPDDTIQMTMPTLTDWRLVDTWPVNDLPMAVKEKIKHHSGMARYSRLFTNPSVADSVKRVYLRINGLHTVARVWVNGKEAGHLWASPWEVDVTDCLQAGENKVCIEVANQLTNRMIGDMALPEEQRTIFATTPLVKAEDPLLPAGITGGVEWVIR